MSATQPASTTELKEYCLRKLGKPVIDINLADEQMDDMIQESIQVTHGIQVVIILGQNQHIKCQIKIIITKYSRHRSHIDCKILHPQMKCR